MNDATQQIGALATEAISLFIDTVDPTPENCWDQPSNLDNWSLHDLMGHATARSSEFDANRSTDGLLRAHGWRLEMSQPSCSSTTPPHPATAKYDMEELSK